MGRGQNWEKDWDVLLPVMKIVAMDNPCSIVEFEPVWKYLKHFHLITERNENSVNNELHRFGKAKKGFINNGDTGDTNSGQRLQNKRRAKLDEYDIPLSHNGVVFLTVKQYKILTGPQHNKDGHHTPDKFKGLHSPGFVGVFEFNDVLALSKDHLDFPLTPEQINIGWLTNRIWKEQVQPYIKYLLASGFITQEQINYHFNIWATQRGMVGVKIRTSTRYCGDGKPYDNIDSRPEFKMFLQEFYYDNRFQDERVVDAN